MWFLHDHERPNNMSKRACANGAAIALSRLYGSPAKIRYNAGSNCRISNGGSQLNPEKVSPNMDTTPRNGKWVRKIGMTRKEQLHGQGRRERKMFNS